MTRARHSASDAGLRTEHRRLRRAFAALLVAVAPSALVQACGTPASPGTTAGTGAGPNAEAGTDAGSGPDADARVSSDGDAALAWAVARWAEARLDSGGRARVAAARARAVRSLQRSLRPWSFDVEVGRPAPAERAALLDGMIRRLGLA